LGPPVERIGALAGFHFDVFGDDCHALGIGKPRYCRALGFNAEAGACCCFVETR
jgi:hypothetical protein